MKAAFAQRNLFKLYFVELNNYMMLRVRRSLYFKRFQKHLRDLHKHLEERDYVQAAEKIWGAISSLINAYLPEEKMRVKDKKEGFSQLFELLPNKRRLNQLLTKYGFKSAYHMAGIASGLHVYFYGGKNYPEEYLKKIMGEFKELLEEIQNALLRK